MRLLIILFYLIIGFIPQAQSTLIICIYQPGELYIGGDSEMTEVFGTNLNFSTAPKIFPMSDTCCVSLSGMYGRRLINKDTGKEVFNNFTVQLKKCCDEARQMKIPFNEKLAFVAEGFQTFYIEYMSFSNWHDITFSDTNITFLTIAGYDDERDEFFAKSDELYATNKITNTTVFNCYPTNQCTDAFFVGEQSFPSALWCSNEEKFKSLRSVSLNKTIEMYNMQQHIPEKQMKEAILEIFASHKKYAASMGMDPGYIGPPYIIYKITPQGMIKINE